MTALWDIAPYSLVEVDRRFRGAYCLHNEGDHRPVMEFLCKKINSSLQRDDPSDHINGAQHEDVYFYDVAVKLGET
jgi:hypothetical protein